MPIATLNTIATTFENRHIRQFKKPFTVSLLRNPSMISMGCPIGQEIFPEKRVMIVFHIPLTKLSQEKILDERF